jgi:hypothetical protein
MNTLDRLRETPDRVDELEKRITAIESKLELLASTVIKLYSHVLGIPIIEKDQIEPSEPYPEEETRQEIFRRQYAKERGEVM